MDTRTEKSPDELIISIKASTDHYTTLGINEKAELTEIKAAYRRLAKIFHPDKFKDKAVKQEEYLEIFKKIGSAYEVLSDQEKKSFYDKQLKNSYFTFATTTTQTYTSGKHTSTEPFTPPTSGNNTYANSTSSFSRASYTHPNTGYAQQGAAYPNNNGGFATHGSNFTHPSHGYASQPGTGFYNGTNYTHPNTNYAQPDTAYMNTSGGYASHGSNSTYSSHGYASQPGTGSFSGANYSHYNSGYAQPGTNYTNTNGGFATHGSNFTHPSHGYYPQSGTGSFSGANYTRPNTGYAQPGTAYSNNNSGYVPHASNHTHSSHGYFPQPGTAYPNNTGGFAPHGSNSTYSSHGYYPQPGTGFNNGTNYTHPNTGYAQSGATFTNNNGGNYATGGTNAYYNTSPTYSSNHDTFNYQHNTFNNYKNNDRYYDYSRQNNPDNNNNTYNNNSKEPITFNLPANIADLIADTCDIGTLQTYLRRPENQLSINSMKSMLYFACKKGKENIVKYLLETERYAYLIEPSNPHFVIKDNDFQGGLLKAAVESNNFSLVKYLHQQHHVDIESRGDNELISTALCMAAFKGNLEIFNYLKENGACVYPTLQGNTLNYALKSENINIEIVRYLLTDGTTLIGENMQSAILSGNLTILKLLLEKEPDLNRHGFSSIFRFDHYAIISGNVTILETLEAHGLYKLTLHGKPLLPDASWLMISGISGSINMMKYLLLDKNLIALLESEEIRCNLITSALDEAKPKVDPSTRVALLKYLLEEMKLQVSLLKLKTIIFNKSKEKFSFETYAYLQSYILKQPEEQAHLHASDQKMIPTFARIVETSLNRLTPKGLFYVYYFINPGHTTPSSEVHNKILKRNFNVEQIRNMIQQEKPEARERLVTACLFYYSTNHFNSDLSFLTLLVNELGANVNSKNRQGYALLHHAFLSSGKSYNNIIKFLILNGANVFVQDPWSNKSLFDRLRNDGNFCRDVSSAQKQNFGDNNFNNSNTTFGNFVNTFSSFNFFNSKPSYDGQDTKNAAEEMFERFQHTY